MTNQQQGPKQRVWKPWISVAAIVVVIVLAVLFRRQWLPQVAQQLASLRSEAGASNRHEGEKEQADHKGHAGHDHGHAGHEEISSLELSSQARKNIGLQTGQVKLQTFVRTMSLPAMVAGRPGRSETDVTALLGGRVTRIYAIEGEAVVPGQPLFDLRLTHEELVRAQSEFLRSAEELDVVEREIRRMESVSIAGAIPGKRKLEREYEKQKIEALINSQRQSLLLHGLTPEQITGIFKDHKLLQGVTVVAPEHAKNGDTETMGRSQDGADTSPRSENTTARESLGTGSQEIPFVVQTMRVKAGQYVEAGAPLCTLFDYARLYIQGRAFEQDADELMVAVRQEWPITAIRETNRDEPDIISGLKIVYVENEVEPDSRALYFYVGLPNEIIHSNETSDGHRFMTWKFRAGQRMQLRVPVEEWQDRIVLSVNAVARDGPEF
ncbi:MAG: efflux RND transporter periplasmic adaptor subunit, partial [Pirellulales bacterium]